MKALVFGLVVLFAAPVFAKGPGPGRKPASGEDLRVMSCNVAFKAKGGMTWHQEQNPGWQLPVKKGKVELKSLGDIKVTLAKEVKGEEAIFRLNVTQKGKLLGDLTAGHSSFEFAAPIILKVEDGEDGWHLDQIRVSCDSTYAAG